MEGIFMGLALSTPNLTESKYVSYCAYIQQRLKNILVSLKEKKRERDTHVAQLCQQLKPILLFYSSLTRNLPDYCTAFLPPFHCQFDSVLYPHSLHNWFSNYYLLSTIFHITSSHLAFAIRFLVPLLTNRRTRVTVGFKSDILKDSTVTNAESYMNVSCLVSLFSDNCVAIVPSRDRCCLKIQVI